VDDSHRQDREKLEAWAAQQDAGSEGTSGSVPVETLEARTAQIAQQLGLTAEQKATHEANKALLKAASILEAPRDVEMQPAEAVA